MIRWLPVLLFLVGSSCYGTLELGDESYDESALVASESATPTLPSTQDTPADAQPQPSTSEPAPSATPSPAPAAEPDPTEEPVEPPVEEEEEEEVEPALPEPGSIVDFEIAQGTGTAAWNTADDPVVVYVGQVLRVTNLDDRDHRMHASSAAPVPHGGRLQPGQSEEYVVSSPLVVGDSAELWDHDIGRSASFWVESRPYPEP